ncbi:unnamed protein product [Linum tenue]|uniref:Leucine-rich repeat-containing N-terminal plant-type domain-containing protein n=1 Tax=Linum tenue TaxID=586396 RepID=A0AAV0RB87_9ROSI|nr:unnamed protein product [Linum tenue]
MATWKEGSDCCLWEGVTCDHFTSHVVGLHLDCPFETTTLHPDSSLFHLRHLRSLDLSRNGFQGSTIPSNFTQLTNLAHLNLSRSRFSGHIPLGFSHLNKLVSLDLSFNGPNGGDNHDFSNLLLNATGLSKLVLHYMDMSNIKPSSFSNLSRSLTYIDLSECGLAGNFPESVFRLPNLQVFLLGYNPLLSVQFPSSNWTAGRLKLTIPASIGNLKSLDTLLLENCSLLGSIPASIGNLTSLTYLDLRDNSLSGKFPDILSNLVRLQHLSLRCNKISGWFPDVFGNLSQELTLLDVSSNNFTGPIPSLIFNLPQLQYLHLHHNFLTSMAILLPSHTEKLEFLDISYNMIEGPLSIPWSPSLSYLSVANNKFAGRIPYRMICNLTILSVINLSNNNLSGEIPACLTNLIQLSTLQLRMNNLHGSFPSVFGNMSSLENLDLNGNTLGGSLSQSLTACKKLEVLDVGNNEISGVFPHWLSSLPVLKVLILHSNSFHGPITTESMNPVDGFSMLRILDISHNYFDGLLPATLFHKFPSMMMLEEFEKTGVEYLETSSIYNEYYTVVLTVKGQEMMITRILTIFTTMDLSNNDFRGSIPEAIGELESLKHLNLSHNSLSGPIPSSLVNLTELEALDLSFNQLTGVIPPQLASLTSLEKLNLSQNLLRGPIPQGNQIQTFDNASYIGNQELCGPPLSKKCNGDDGDGNDHHDDSEPEFDGALFDWAFAGAGYGCGLVIGISAAYIMFTIRKPRWLVDMIDKWIRWQQQNRRWRPAITF